MAQASVFVINDTGSLARMRQAKPSSEDRMQLLLSQHPEVISFDGEELLLIDREQGIPSESSGGQRWSIDHLYVTQDAIPVLVEVKRASDTRIRREVVGQMMDYAANASVYWAPGSLEMSFRGRLLHEADGVLDAFLENRDGSEFWSQVEANLRGGRFRMVFVGDEIPEELERVVTFLDEQMTADVRAVELRWFEGENGKLTLVPRHIGGAKREARRSRRTHVISISVDAWIESKVSPFGQDYIDAAQEFLTLIEELGGQAVVASTGGSIVGVFKSASGDLLYPLHLWKKTISMSLHYVKRRPALQSELVRQRLLEEFSSGVSPLSNDNPDGFPAFNATALLNPGVRLKTAVFLRRYLDLAISER